MLSTLDASGATTSGGVAGTSGESGTYSNPEIKKRRGIFLKMCQTPGGFNRNLTRCAPEYKVKPPGVEDWGSRLNTSPVFRPLVI